MDSRLINSFIRVVRAEERRRQKCRSAIESDDAAEAQWLFTDLPFVNGLYLLVLVFTWHEVEKQLVCLAARADNSLTTEITIEEYKKGVEDLTAKSNGMM